MASRGNVSLRVDVHPLRARLVKRLRTYHRGRSRVVSDPSILSGEPVFDGTRVPVDHIVGMVRRGVELAELREDYPALGEADLAYATMLARMKADPGRPLAAEQPTNGS